MLCASACFEVLFEVLLFRVAQNSGAMAGALVRKARTYLASGAVRAWTPAFWQQRVLAADRANLEVARRFSSTSSSSSVVSVYSKEEFLGNISWYNTSRACPQLLRQKESIASLLPHSVRGLASQSAPRLQRQQYQDEVSKHQQRQQYQDEVRKHQQRQQYQDESKGLSKQADEDPFDSITDKIPERPVSVAEGASYSLIILAGLAVAAVAAYAVMKELIFEPKEYKIFGKALNRVQNESQVLVRLGSPITGYGQESRNRAARQRISNRTYVDEDGVERVEVMFYIRGPQGAGKVYSEMFKDKEDNAWKYTYLIVDITSPSATRLMLESYMPAMPAPIRA